MKKDWKSKIAKATAGNRELDRRILGLKASWDEVEGLLNKPAKKKRK